MNSKDAVCLTGLERSFSEIGANVREAVLRFLGPSSSPTFFGVRPPADPWRTVHLLLPMHETVLQTRCWTPEQASVTLSWLHCNMRVRKNWDCRLGALQVFCDLAACEDVSGVSVVK